MKSTRADIVDNGLGVRHADDGGDTACGSSTARGGQCFAVLVPRLAGKHEHIDETWREDVAGAVDELRVANGVGSYLRAQVDDLAVLDQHAARLVEAGAGVDQPRVEECAAAAVAVVVGLHRHHWFGRCRASA